MNRAPPELSVIVSAWSRSRFLRAAIDSVREQTIPRDRYEVIVNTNLSEHELQDAGIPRDYRTLYNNESAQGPFYRKAISESSGRILAFLDDDDRWEPTRLERLASTLRDNPEVGLYHNAHSHMSELGERARARPALSRLAWREVRQPLRVLPPIPPPILGRLLRSGAGFNLSSAAVRRDCVLPWMSYLERLPASDDTFLLYATVLSGRGVWLDPLRLTAYRIHSSNLSRSSALSPAGADLWSERALQSCRIFRQMAHAVGRLDFDSCLDREVAYLRVLNDVVNIAKRRQEVAGDLMTLTQRFRSVNPPMNVAMLGLGACRLVSIRLGLAMRSSFHV
jgi:glycosyltransferase involved in cell wall biosynthesis